MSPNPTALRYELRTRDGIPITYAVDYLSAGTPLDGLYRTDTRFDLEYAERTTDIDYDHPEAYIVGGELTFEDANGNIHLAGDLKIIQINPDGTENELDREFTEGYEKPLTSGNLHSEVTKAKRALQLATWVAEASDESDHRGFLTEAARTRITNRAKAHAEAEGLTPMLEAILTSSNLHH